MATELRGIEELLASRIGLDPISVGSPLILRAARRRMTELGLDDLVHTSAGWPIGGWSCKS